jgi:uncharacterized protein YjdB
LIGVLLLFGACPNPADDNDDNDNNQTVAVTGVAISPANPQVTRGGTLQLTATVSPAEATNKTITWTSSASTVAGVSNAGLVTGLATGTATILTSTARAWFFSSFRARI